MWTDLLRDQVSRRGLGSVAAELDYSKATLSLVLNNKYDSNTRRIEDAVLRAFAALHCPFEARQISAADCRFWCGSDQSTSSAWAQHHRDACQACPHNTSKKDSR